jgi:hypothetical protein
MDARRRSTGSENCSMSASFTAAMDTGGMFIGLPCKDQLLRLIAAGCLSR